MRQWLRAAVRLILAGAAVCALLAGAATAQEPARPDPNPPAAAEPAEVPDTAPPADSVEQTPAASAGSATAETGSADTPASPPVEQVLATSPALRPLAETEAALHEILAQAKYTESVQPEEPRETWLDRFIAWLDRFLSRLGLGGQPWMIQVAAFVLILALVYLIARLVWEFFRRHDTRAGEREPGKVREPDADTLLEEAQAALKQGDVRLAVRLRFLALYKQLNLPGSTVRTNRQAARWLREHRPACATGFQSVAVLFEDAWYGGQPCDSGDFQRMNELAGQVVQAAADGEDEP